MKHNNRCGTGGPLVDVLGAKKGGRWSRNLLPYRPARSTSWISLVPSWHPALHSLRTCAPGVFLAKLSWRSHRSHRSGWVGTIEPGTTRDNTNSKIVEAAGSTEHLQYVCLVVSFFFWKWSVANLVARESSSSSIFK